MTAKQKPKPSRVDFDELPAVPTDKIVKLMTREKNRRTRAMNILKNMVGYADREADPWMVWPAGDLDHQLSIAVIDLYFAGLARLATGTHPETEELIGGVCPTETAFHLQRNP